MSYSIPVPQSVGVNTKTILQPLDQKPAPGTRPYYPTITNISTEPRLDGTEAVYVQTFLIDAVTKNQKGWKVSFDNPTDFDRRVLDSKNHPLVLFPTADKNGTLIYDHPIAPITTLEAAADPVRANIEFQKKYTIGYARFFKKIKEGVWAATYEITEPKAKKFFINAKNKGIKLYTSPYIVRPSGEPNRLNIKEWSLIHNAIVSQPAFGADVASIKNMCISEKGDPYACQSLFASLTTPDDIEPDFDVEEALSYLTSQITQESLITNMTDESASMEQPTQSSVVLTQPNPADSTVVTKTIPQSQLLDKEPQKQEQNDPSKEPNKEEEDELTLLKSQIEKLTKQNQNLQEKYAYDTRKANIEKIFGPIVGTVFADRKTGVVDEKEYNTEIERLTKSNFGFDEINELAQARFVIAQYQSNKRPERASLTSHFDETSAFNYTKMATGNNKEDCGCPNKLGFNIFKQTLSGGF